MAKKRKSKKRLNKKEITKLLVDLFEYKGKQQLSLKQIYSELKLTTHPQKMLAK